MPKDEVLRRIDQRGSAGIGAIASPARPSVQGLGNADMVDGIDASRVPMPNVLLALNSRAKFPASVIEGLHGFADQYMGSWGRVVIGPTVFLLSDLASADTEIWVSDNWLEEGMYAYMSLGEGVNEIVRIDDDGTADREGYRYSVKRAADGGRAYDFPEGTAVIGVGAEGGGYMVDVSVADDGPYRDMFTRESDSATDVVRRLRIGNLKGILGIAETMFGLAIGDLRDGSREYLLASKFGIDFHGGNAVGYDHERHPCWGIFSRDTAVPGVGSFAAGDSFFGWPGTDQEPRGNVVIQGSAGRIVFRAGQKEVLVIDGEAQTLLGLMYVGTPFGPAIVFDGGKQIRARNADGLDGFVVMAGTKRDPNELYIQIGWSDPYSPKIILSNDGLWIDVEALRGTINLSNVTIDHGGLVGLADDDHPIYLTVSRHAALSDPADLHDPKTHTHVEADITDLEHDAVKLQGRAIGVAAPSDGDVLTWNATASQWEPQAGGGGTGTVQPEDVWFYQAIGV